MTVDCELVHGIQLGIEHIDCREDNMGFNWMIVVNLFFVRFCFTDT